MYANNTKRVLFKANVGLTAKRHFVYELRNTSCFLFFLINE